MAGRPAIPFDQEIADELCERLSTSNKATPTILAELPEAIGKTVGLTTLFKWLREEGQFLKDYERAKGEQADFLAEEIIEISDDSGLDTEVDEDGRVIVKGENIQRSRLRIDARKWVASKLKPKKYGDKIEQTLQNPDGSALAVKVIMDI
jgi:hypothetical protein